MPPAPGVPGSYNGTTVGNVGVIVDDRPGFRGGRGPEQHGGGR